MPDKVVRAMTRSDLVYHIKEWSFKITPAQAEQIVNTILDEIVATVKRGDRVEIRNFGRFVPRHRKAHAVHNPQTGEMMTVPDKTVMFFMAGKGLKEVLNGKDPGRRTTDVYW